MTDENTLLTGHQLFSEYSATAQWDTEAREEAPPIDRVFISIVFRRKDYGGHGARRGAWCNVRLIYS